MELYGIRGVALSWMKSYLENRKIQVKYKNTLSTVKTVNIGLPQGSILGPIFFISYIDNLPLASKNYFPLCTQMTQIFLMLIIIFLPW